MEIKMKYLVKNLINGVISYKDKTISSFIIIENIDREIKELAERGFVKIEKYIEKENKKNEKINIDSELSLLDDEKNKKHRR
jgi:hypothetical protein